MKLTPSFALWMATALIGSSLCAQDIDITKFGDPSGFPKALPIHVSGFTGEVDAILRFDLLFNGFAVVSQDKARYLLQGNNGAERVEGRLVDPISKATKLAKAFTGGTVRAQTHALADEVARACGLIGIAQSRIAFVVQPNGVGPGEIFISDYDGHNAQALTQDGVIVAAPAWGGRSTLFYTSYKFGRPEIFSQNLGTGARRAVARFNGLNTSVAVSPDGKRLAMILSKSGSPDLYVSDLDGGNLKQLTATKEPESSPCWAPDSRTLCFCSTKSGRRALYTISADGGDMTHLPTMGISNPTEPDWSPDGKFIVFTAQMGDFHICYVPTQGPRRGQATVVVAGEDPVWAPNSRTVAFSRSVNHRHVLSLLDVPSKQVKDVARTTGSASQPAWAR